MTDWLETLLLPFRYFVEPQQRIYWYNLLIAVFAASLLYVFNRDSGQRKTLVGLFSYIIPKNVYLHKSAINDYFYFFANTLLYAIFILPFFSVLSINVATAVEQNIGDLLPLHQDTLDGSNATLAVFFTVAFGIFLDFAIFFIHYLEHRIPWLWEFHKVHHSAQVLTPITVYRMHPVDDIVTFSFSGLFVGTMIGIFQYLFKPEIIIFNVAGTNLLFILFYVFFYNLRHSHIWLGYGPVVSYIFISPAQHQIHHSSDLRHRDKNMGFIFAFWDYLFGTLYVPVGKEQFSLGIDPNEDAKFQNFWSLYLMPFLNLRQFFTVSELINRKNLASILVFCAIIGTAVYFSKNGAYQPVRSETVFMEDMTWPEIREVLANGTTTVLIPTGGTEQNGPHLILGKHNYIIRYTCGKIAEELGNTLVAPVISYVPEGNIYPPDGHMRFPGTISVSNQVFSDLLESTAESLKAHGFKVIAFVGDSGGNQSVQEEVAKRLNGQWNSRGIRVIHVGDYYSGNGQARYLINEGHTPEQIGSHAGILDTSELLAVYPKGVKIHLLADNPVNEFVSSGADGDSTQASGLLGTALLNLKIQSAVRQINNVLTRDPVQPK